MEMMISSSIDKYACDNEIKKRNDVMHMVSTNIIKLLTLLCMYLMQVIIMNMSTNRVSLIINANEMSLIEKSIILMMLIMTLINGASFYMLEYDHNHDIKKYNSCLLLQSSINCLMIFIAM
jgi:hypothetical protein